MARLPGDDARVSLWGVLVAGGGNGKTEMMAGYTESIVEVDPATSAALAVLAASRRRPHRPYRSLARRGGEPLSALAELEASVPHFANVRVLVA